MSKLAHDGCVTPLLLQEVQKHDSYMSLLADACLSTFAECNEVSYFYLPCSLFCFLAARVIPFMAAFLLLPLLFTLLPTTNPISLRTAGLATLNNYNQQCSSFKLKQSVRCSMNKVSETQVILSLSQQKILARSA